MTHRCEAKDYSQAKVKTGGRVNRTTRCASKDTNRAVLDPRCEHYATYIARGETEAFFCDEHRGYMGARGISKWMPA